MTAAAERTLVSLDEITIKRERFRPATGDMEGLATSLVVYGQLAPVILDDDGSLLAGFRRYTAALMNGWTTIWAVHQGDIDEQLAREIELEENLQREQMSWEEKARGLAELDRIKRISNPNWGQAQTAAAAGGKTTQRDVSQAAKVIKMMELFPELKNAKSLNQALSWAESKASNVLRVQEVKENPVAFASIEAKIILGDSVEVIKTIPDESFHAVITDPPFGLDYDERKAGTDGSLTSYKDDEDAYRRLLSMAPDIYRVLKPNGWLIWFFGLSWYPEVKHAFREAGFTVDELPIVWNRSEGRVHTNRPDRYFGRGYDVALHAFKGNAQINPGFRNKPNVITVKPIEAQERVTLVERPTDLYAEFIRRLTVPGETVADFFVGGGGCPAACASMGRDYFGVEQDPERRAYAIKKIKANTPD